MDYDYRQAMREDIAQAIAEKEEWIGKRITEAYEDKEEAYDQLFDDMWVNDSVTGNGSGSYTFNRYKAEEYLTHNLGIVRRSPRRIWRRPQRHIRQWRRRSVRCND